ncbi:hypothetical protein [Sphingomonas sp. S2-65]|uniref:hypothetical protein n=1 Tax=Sphingomonas sp. S2-65 TaxID=2903960 RepID=UPI001F41BAAD|nr:hypothetical protein [Sphingomonas sp. S2-65]UYY57379.1 hypothetical protein LZ586_11890 [Sphingomonas sp. S2-65]
MRNGLIGLSLLLAACSGEGDGTGNATVATTNDPTAQNVAEAAANGTPAAVAAATDCSNKPDFVPIYREAQVTSCISGPDGEPRHVSGSIVYTTHTSPNDIRAWSLDQAKAAGFIDAAVQGDKLTTGVSEGRKLMIVSEAYNGATRVTVNWSGPVR